ncbi:hypothetical protein HQQ82_12495 [Rathayibacter sp. VKM Ac-2856]|uniref:hypothetical protein n=1 Tax=unclassified Rathayibacter TaxID=2609250 RepID=UPI001564BF27|nr:MULTISPECIES: hypothetical protein [unclassified Rathayibacter]NQX05329.1 hypothetical protein [Rathayibacter sp. VKM Ac-2858]NQX20796.1 hypothetical protein [Rathayibacter sp. VKM Ac-2856]
MTKRWWLSLAAVAATGLAVGGATLFSWTISETQFDRPDPRFDRLTAQVADLPGVTAPESSRWVEAPVFADPTSWIGVDVDPAGLAALLDTACSTDYGDPVSWSVRVQTDAGTTLAVNSPADERPAGARCPDFGVDPAGLLAPLDSTVRGLELQAAVWPDSGGGGHLALTALEDPADIADLLPLVARAEDLRAAAGVAAGSPVEISGVDLSVLVLPGEQERYAELLTELVARHGVTGYFAGAPGTQIDGVDKVQLVAPESEHAAIEELIGRSGLHVAELPVRFLPES